MLDVDTFRRRTAPLALLAGGLLMAAFVTWGMTRLQRLGAYERPDHHYSVVLYRKHSAWPGVRPLDPADFPAEVRLVDASGHVLESKSVDSMTKVGEVTWRDRRVAIEGVADWSLPD